MVEYLRMRALPTAGEGQVRIRPAVTNDLETVVTLHHLVREVSMPYLPTLHTVDESLVFFSGVFEECQVHVAEDDGGIVGYCAFKAGWLDHLYVHPEHQSKGIGHALLLRAMDHQQELKLWMFQKSHNAIRFYEGAGFTLVKTTDGLSNKEREPDALYSWCHPSNQKALAAIADVNVSRRYS